MRFDTRRRALSGPERLLVPLLKLNDPLLRNVYNSLGGLEETSRRFRPFAELSNVLGSSDFGFWFWHGRNVRSHRHGVKKRRQQRATQR